MAGGGHITDYRHLIDAETWAFIAKTAAAYPDDTASRSVAEQRKIYNAMCRLFDAGRPEGVMVRDRSLGQLRLRDYSLQGGAGAARVLFFHGGGFVVGDLDSHDDVCAEICARTGFAVTAVEYRLAPEHAFPGDHEDACAAWDDLARHPGPVVLVGDSAGGNLCAGLAHVLRGAGKQPRGQVLIYPGLGGGFGTASMERHAAAPMLTRADCEFYKGVRVGGRLDLLDDPRCSPLAAKDFSGLPPTVAFAAECDPIADDARLYAEAIRAAGGAAVAIPEQGLVHGYLRARHCVTRARESFTRIVEAIACLGQGRTPDSFSFASGAFASRA